MTQPTLINLRPNEYSEGLRYYPFAVHLDRRVGSFNTFNDPIVNNLIKYVFQIKQKI